jgi:hypothetical protein
MDECSGRLLSNWKGRAGVRQLFVGVQRVGLQRESRMDDRGPLDRPFLVFVIIVAIAVLALGIAIYPSP